MVPRTRRIVDSDMFLGANASKGQRHTIAQVQNSRLCAPGDLYPKVICSELNLAATRAPGDPAVSVYQYFLPLKPLGIQVPAAESGWSEVRTVAVLLLVSESLPTHKRFPTRLCVGTQMSSSELLNEQKAAMFLANVAAWQAEKAEQAEQAALTSEAHLQHLLHLSSQFLQSLHHKGQRWSGFLFEKAKATSSAAPGKM